MPRNYEIEIVRKVYDNKNGHFLSVSPSADFPGNVMLYTTPDNAEYFGALRLDLPLEMMKLVGAALMATAHDIEAEGTED